MANILTSEREKQIIDMIRKKGSVSVKELAEHFQVSGMTIRTDLKRLEESGTIIRTHGGATLRSSFTREMGMSEREHHEEKLAIGEAAISYVSPDDPILIDTGTTMTAFARALLRSSVKGLRIFTVDLEVAEILENNPTFEVHLLGGRVRNGFHYCYGHQVINELENYHFEQLFLASSAIDIENGLTTSNVELAELKQAMIKASRKIILLADSSKLNYTDFRQFAALTDIDVLITDSNLPDNTRSSLEDAIGQVVITPGA